MIGLIPLLVLTGCWSLTIVLIVFTVQTAMRSML